MDGLSAYELMRRANLNENNQCLKEYGVQASVVEATSITLGERKEPKRGPPKGIIKKRAKPEPSVVERRTSFRVRLKLQPDCFEEYEPLKDSDDEDEAELLKNLSQPNRRIVRPPRPNSYGIIEGVKVGTWWETRLDCNYDGIHRPTVAGIHQGPDGAYSVALSGGYEDDVDYGDSFTYTGEGGRDLKGTASNPKNLRTAPQSKHQTLDRGNLALSRNVETGNPVRVIRGYKLNSKFAPDRGYRYDGLYNVTKYWETTGKAGFRIYKFQFQRCDPEPAPWCKGSKPTSPINKQSGSRMEAEEVDDSCIETPSKMNHNSTSILKGKSDNTPEKNSRKVVYFQLSPGEESPIKVKNDIQSLGNLAIVCKDMGWHGWSAESIPPQSDCLSVVYEGHLEHIRLTGDEWVKASDCNEHAPVAACENTSLLEPQEHDEDNISELEVIEPRDTQGENWCGWDKVNTLNKCQCFTLKYDGCVVRVCEKEGKWKEVNGNEPLFSSKYRCDDVVCDLDEPNDPCDWAGWPEECFSVLDCPSTFNCVLREKL